MKIAVLEPYIEGFGGAQKVISEYCDYLKKTGYEVEIFTQRYSPNKCYPLFKSIKINLIKPSSKFFSPFTFMKKIKDFDLIIANDWPTHFSSLRNKNVVWICYNPKRDFYDLKSFYHSNSSLTKKIMLYTKEILFKKLDKISAHKCIKIFPISNNIKERVKTYYGIESEFIFIPGIHFKDYEFKKYGDYFLSVSRIVKSKRVDIIVESMNRIKNKKIKLYVVGTGSEIKNVLELAKSNENVVFLGEVDNEKLKSLYSNCFGVIYIPIEEDWGLIPLEAAASHKPIIGANEGGLKETIINNKTGILIENPDPEKLAKEIEFLFKNKKNAKKMGETAYDHLSKLDWKFILPNFEKELKKIKKCL